jgi:hypothetical protein
MRLLDQRYLQNTSVVELLLSDHRVYNCQKRFWQKAHQVDSDSEDSGSEDAQDDHRDYTFDMSWYCKLKELELQRMAYRQYEESQSDLEDESGSDENQDKTTINSFVMSWYYKVKIVNVS